MARSKLVRNVKRGDKFRIRSERYEAVVTAASDAQETRSGHFTRRRQWMIPANYPWWWGASAVTGYSDTRIELVA
jgi:hypothetical protein